MSHCDCENDGCTVHLGKHSCHKKARVVVLLKDYAYDSTQERSMCFKCAVDYAQLGRLFLITFLE